MDQIVDTVTAEALQVSAAGAHALVGWIITRYQRAYPGKVVARLVTTTPTPHVLLAETLAALRALLPPGLERSERQPDYPSDVIEVWFVPKASPYFMGHTL